MAKFSDNQRRIIAIYRTQLNKQSSEFAAMTASLAEISTKMRVRLTSDQVNKLYTAYLMTANAVDKPQDKHSLSSTGEILMYSKQIVTCYELTNSHREGEDWLTIEREALIHMMKENRISSEASINKMCEEKGVAVFFNRSNGAIYQKAIEIYNRNKK
jgi:hypothetical protein